MDNDTINIKKWIDCWDKAHIELTSIKSIEMSNENYLFDSISSLSEVFNYALSYSAPSTSSGLVEMQKYFSKLRKK